MAGPVASGPPQAQGEHTPRTFSPAVWQGWDTPAPIAEPQPSPWGLQWGPVSDLGGLGGSGTGEGEAAASHPWDVLGWAGTQAGWGIGQARGQGPASPPAALTCGTNPTFAESQSSPQNQKKDARLGLVP